MTLTYVVQKIASILFVIEWQQSDPAVNINKAEKYPKK